MLHKGRNTTQDQTVLLYGRPMLPLMQMPQLGEQIDVCTWPGEVKLGMYSRRYVVFDAGGKELLKTSSLFMMIDESTRKMIPPNQLPQELAEIVMEGQPILPKQRIKFPELPLVQIHTVTESEIDKNGHVNNAYYINWAYELLHKEYVLNHPLKYFWVQYSKELVKDQAVELQHTMVDREFFVKGAVGSDISFLVKMDFTE